MRVFDLFTATVIVLVHGLASGRTGDETPDLQEDLQDEFEAQVLFIPKDPVGLLNIEATMIHHVFRILREQIAIMNSVIEGLAERRTHKSRTSHPEILSGVSQSVAQAKEGINSVLHKTKRAKKIVKEAKSLPQVDAVILRPYLEGAVSLVLEVIEENMESIRETCDALEKQKTGLYSRKEKLGNVIGDSPERLRATIAHLQEVEDQALAVAEAVEGLSD